MKRSALALLGLLALPAAAAAQDQPLLANEPTPQRLPDARFSISPFLGVRVPFSGGDQVFFGPGGEQFQASSERGGAPMAGADVRVRLRGPVSLYAGGSYSASRQDLLTVVSDAGTTTKYELDGPAMWTAKAGVSVRLPDPMPDNRRFHPSALVNVAPAIVWMDWPSSSSLSDDITRSTHHFAVNVGFDAVTRLGRSERWALDLGLQDYVVFWNTDALRARDAAVGEIVTGTPVTIDYDYSTSNLIGLKLGVTVRVQ